MLRGLVVAIAFCASASAAQSPMPFALGGPYKLTNQFGEVRTEKDPDGRAQLLFFGYANCQNICSAALPTMASVVDVLAEEAIEITPVMITVAPDQDQVSTMGAPLADIHPDFIGLTGDQHALQVAYDAFSVEVKPLFEDPEYGWIYAHGSFIHLLDSNGEVLTVLPPVLSVEETSKILRNYLRPNNTL